MSKGEKYLGLKKYLETSGLPMIKLSFEQIESIINNELPQSAFNHAEAWWSNSICHSQAVAWLDAGYVTDLISDTYKDKQIVFMKR